MFGNHKLHRDTERARQANELLTHPLLTEAFDTIEKEIYDLWLNQTKSAQQREEAHQLLRSQKRFRTFLESLVNNGKMSLKELERLEAKQSSQRSPVLD